MIAAVVPFKGGADAKSRLSSAMSVRERQRLSFQLLHHVLSVLSRAEEIDRVAVVGRIPIPNTAFVADPGGGLNPAVARGIRWSIGLGADAIVVLPADLPFITRSDIAALINLMPSGSGGVVAPSKDGGTGALLLRPPMLVDPCFGPHSGQRHMTAIRDAGGTISVLQRSGLAIDIDVPADLDLLGDELLDVAWSRNGSGPHIGIDATNKTGEHSAGADFDA